MAFETNALGTFQEGCWFTLHAYLTIACGFPIFFVLEGSKIDKLNKAR
jgi:hypothetical protein